MIWKRRRAAVGSWNNYARTQIGKNMRHVAIGTRGFSGICPITTPAFTTLRISCTPTYPLSDNEMQTQSGVIYQSPVVLSLLSNSDFKLTQLYFIIFHGDWNKAMPFCSQIFWNLNPRKKLHWKIPNRLPSLILNFIYFILFTCYFDWLKLLYHVRIVRT